MTDDERQELEQRNAHLAALLEQARVEGFRLAAEVVALRAEVARLRERL